MNRESRMRIIGSPLLPKRPGIEYASRALSLEPGIQDAYYWISIAAEATGNSMMKDWYDQMARDELPEEEYQKVQHLLEIRTHKEE